MIWFDDKGANVVDVWESPEHFQRFGEERLMPVTSQLLDSEPDVQFHDAHTYFNAELN